MKLLNKNNKNKLNNNGITLIALVITIIILLILASVIIKLVINNNGILNKSSESAFKTKMSQISEEYNIYKTGQILEATMQGTEEQVINAGETLKQIIQNEEYEIDVEEDSVLNIRQMLKSVRSYRRRILNSL